MVAPGNLAFLQLGAREPNVRQSASHGVHAACESLRKGARGASEQPALKRAYIRFTRTRRICFSITLLGSLRPMFRIHNDP